MAGLTERAGPEGDNFWRWREVMYRFLSVLTPEDVEAIAAQLYIECLQHGYTAIAEFHYLHNAADGTPYADPTELAQRIAAAAAHSGIDLTLLPVLYRHAQFGGAPVLPAQRRFVLSFDAYASLCQTMAVTCSRWRCAAFVACGDAGRTGRRHWAGRYARSGHAVAHPCRGAGEGGRGLRGVERGAAGAVAVAACAGGAPLVPGARDAHRRRKSPGFSLRAARSSDCARRPRPISVMGFSLCLDGSPMAGGSASAAIQMSRPVRWRNCAGWSTSARLETHTRNVTETQAGASVGLGLYRRALAGGAQALGRRAGAIATGQIADLVVLDTDHPALVGRAGDALLDAWMFCGNATPVRDVMVAGTWQVRDGRHRRQDAIRADFARSMRRIAATIF